MLVGIVVEPGCFGPVAVIDGDSRGAAERVLDALAENAVLIGPCGRDLIREIIDNVAALNTKLGQQLQIRIAELAKMRQRVCVSSEAPLPGDEREQLIEAARVLRADIVVCSCVESAERARDTLAGSTEICGLPEYPTSNADRLRKALSQTQRLDRPGCGLSAEEIVGRAVKYCMNITIADNFIGVAAKEYPARKTLESYVRGALFIAEQWGQHSPFANSRKLNMLILTAAGDTGARGGFINPTEAKARIEVVFQRLAGALGLGSITIAAKKQATPKIFRDRFLEAGGRCWGIRHSLDDFARLRTNSANKSPTFIDPHSEANRGLLSEILMLADA